MLRSCFLLYSLLHFSIASYESEDSSQSAHFPSKVFKIEGKVSVHDEKLKGGLYCWTLFIGLRKSNLCVINASRKSQYGIDGT